MASDADLARHRAVFQEALAIYVDRDMVRDGLWKDYDARDQAVAAKLKMDRVLSLLDKKPEDWAEHAMKEIPDIINYVIYAARLLKPGEDGEV